MKVLAAAGVAVISLVVIVLQATGWSQSQPKTVNLSETSTRSSDGPLIESSSVGPGAIATPDGLARTQPSSGTRLVAQVQQTSQFIWPAQGPISSYFGAYHVLGIDIALDNSEDSPILAAADGVVEFAGGSTCCEYGLYVLLNHEGNRSTLYGHLSSLVVSEGQDVSQGQLLGYGGSTGVSDGKHLHFELHENGTLVDPLRFLPAVERSTQLSAVRTDCTSDFLRIDPESKLLIEFNDVAGFRPTSVRFDDGATAAGFSAGVEGLGGLTRRISVAVPPAPAARGFIRDVNLTVTLSDGPNQQNLECAMRLATMETRANAPRVTKHPGTSLKPGTPTATPIRSKYALPTPTATPAPKAPPGTSGVATPRPAVTPQPVATTKPAPTVKPPQQFPITR